MTDISDGGVRPAALGADTYAFVRLGSCQTRHLLFYVHSDEFHNFFSVIQSHSVEVRDHSDYRNAVACPNTDASLRHLF